MKLIRGPRFLQALLEDNTYQGLYRNIEKGFPKTKKRQHALKDVVGLYIDYLPFHEDKALQVNGHAHSNGHLYEPTIQFFYVQYEPEQTDTTARFVGVDNKEYYVQPIKLGQNNVKVRCTCLDFYYRFSTWNGKDNSLYGPTPQIQSQGIRPPVNPKRVPGICKHVIKLVQSLEQVGLLQR